MEYIRITKIDDPLFAKMHAFMQSVFPPEEVLEFSQWEGPLGDEGLRVYVAVHEGEVVGATEYRYYPDLNVAMTDFTIVGKAGLSIGRFLAKNREADLLEWAKSTGQTSLGMFAEIYDPYRVEEKFQGKVKVMDPYVRREVLSHLGYKRLDFSYLHPSWEDNGATAVSGLDLGFMPADDSVTELPAALVVQFLTTYYAILANKPQEWLDMVDSLKQKETVKLLGL